MRVWRTVSAFVFAAASLVWSAAHAALPAGLDDASIRAAAADSFPAFFELLALPNDAVNASDIQKNAAWLQRAFEQRGFRVRQLENKGRPLVFAEYRQEDADARTASADPPRGTVLFYMHFDGQPVVPTQWSQQDPWRAVVKRRGADGRWTDVEQSLLMRPDFDPELRVFARSASDDKGPIMMFLAAFDLLRARHVAPHIGVKVLLDSEEEKESPGMAAVVAANQALLQADALVIHDSAIHASGRPTIIFGNRGIVPVTLTVFGPRSPLHSGHYGNYAPNPAQRLAALLASMKSDDGRVIIPGYYSRTRLSAADLTILADTGDDERALLRRLGVAESDRVGATYQEALQYPSLNIRGFAAAGVGDKVATVIPDRAVAELDLRTTVEADGEYLTGLLRQHIERQGFHLVDGEPTDDERMRYPKLARMRVGHFEKAARQPMDSPVGRWATAALESAHASEGEAGRPVRIRMMGATVPTYEIITPLAMPFVLIPLVNPDNNQHTFDENLRMGHFIAGMRTMLGLLLQPYGEQ